MDSLVLCLKRLTSGEEVEGAAEEGLSAARQLGTSDFWRAVADHGIQLASLARWVGGRGRPGFS